MSSDRWNEADEIERRGKDHGTHAVPVYLLRAAGNARTWGEMEM